MATTFLKKQDKKEKADSQIEHQQKPSTKLKDAETYFKKYGFPKFANEMK